MIYITYYDLEMKRQTMRVVLVNEYRKTSDKVEEAGADYSKTTVMLRSPCCGSDIDGVSWEESCMEEELFAEENETNYQGLPGSVYRNDID